VTDLQKGRWAIAAMFLANGFVMGAWAPQIPLLLPRHDIGEATLGLLILGLGAGAVGAMVFCGRLIERHGARLVLRAFMLSIVPVLPVVVFAPSVPVLAVAMAIFGAMIGCMDVAMNAHAVEVERRMGRAIMSSCHGFWSLGGFLGGGLGGLMIARTGAEAQALMTAGVTAALVLGATRFLIPGDPPAPPTKGPRTRLLPRDPGLWLLGGLALLSMVPEGAVLDWAALYMAQDMGAGVATSGLAFAFFAGAMAVMRFLGDLVRNRFGAVRTLRISALIGAAGMMAAAMAPTPALAIAGFAIAGLGVANMVPVIFSAAGNHPGLPSGAALAVVTMVGYSGILVAPASIGVAAEAVGFRATFGALAALLVVVAMLATRAQAAETGARH
jgi:predicted MFS family arabinose efflux permease